MNLSKATEEFIQGHPSVKDCIQNGLINYSSLARLIISGLKLKKSDFDAVLVACRRYSEKIKPSLSLENKIRALFKESKLEIKNKVVVFVVSQRIPFRSLVELAKNISEKDGLIQLIHGSKTFTVVTTQDFAGLIKRNCSSFILAERADLVEINIKTSEDIEEIPGVISYIYSLLSENNINVFETMSSWTDTLMVIDEKDLPKAMQLLRFS